MEKIINVKTNSSIGGLNTMADVNGSLEISVDLTQENINVGTELKILEDPKISSVHILEQRERQNSTEGIECEMLLNSREDVDIHIDIDGSIYVTTKGEHVEDYEINANAELEFKQY